MTEKQNRAIDAARAFSSAVNEMGFDHAAFAQEIRRDHRTLQQNTMRAIIELMRQWSNDFETGNFDLRNADTVKIANQTVKNNPNMYLQYV